MLRRLTTELPLSDITPPSLALMMLEGRALAEANQVVLALPLLRLQARRGHGQPVMVLPGFMMNDMTTGLLRHYLDAIGYDVYPWALGRNRRPMMDILPHLLQKVTRVKNRSGQKVRLVGWSRGGILCREIARDRPDLVERVITLGSPVKGGTGASSIGNWVRRETGLSPAQMTSLMRQRNQAPITVPVRAIYSRSDGVVAWKACIDEHSPDIEHFEVSCSHSGMGASVEVFRLLPDLLL